MCLQKIIVRPTYPIVPGVEDLGPLDQYTVRMYMPIACLFRVDSPALRPKILQDLQAGLSRTIDDINFLAANIIPQSEETDTIQLEYGDNPGVSFYYQVIEAVEYQALFASHFLFSPEFVEQFVPEPQLHQQPRSPVLTAKVTFITGGLILTINPHHSILDAHGVAQIIHLWARHTAAESEGRTLGEGERPTPESIDPYFAGGHGPRERSEFNPYQVSPDIDYVATQADIMRRVLSGDKTRPELIPKASHWLISPSLLNKLHATASSPSANMPTVTQNSVIAALIWQRMIATWQVLGHEMKSSALRTTVNLRRRMDPPLPAGYLRNVIVLSGATVDIQHMQTISSDPVYYLARQIGDSIEWWTPERIWDFTSAIDSWPDKNGRIFPPVGRDVFVTTPSQLGELVWESRWGRELGAVQALRSAATAYLDGTTLVLPTADGGRDIMIFTTTEVIEILKNDTAWTTWVEFLG
ncbi:hypothetical protein N7520_009146 [Penicillium odoratum]|uniref:uncharacterized protein n=1 Tax=Penicillium odoratum TaxID=1167516 RepID=UPI002546FDA4|nr:uncharacterized protein N7520_009146 [Penicillium odoratum]KAJ5752229.1 hypothetical protein N7520_009146 [Penicillium odoratum]